MKHLHLTLILAALASTLVGCSSAKKVEKFEEEEKVAKSNLNEFDKLDFEDFSNQDWDAFGETHAEDIVVHWPDGRTTQGLESHTDDLKNMFAYAPDTQITQHPIKIADKNFTSVAGVMEGTFSDPMATADGKVIQPTGKKFKVDMVTIGRWKNGVMVEEWLYWDNLAFMKQIGVIQ